MLATRKELQRVDLRSHVLVFLNFICRICLTYRMSSYVNIYPWNSILLRMDILKISCYILNSSVLQMLYCSCLCFLPFALSPAWDTWKFVFHKDHLNIIIWRLLWKFFHLICSLLLSFIWIVDPFLRYLLAKWVWSFHLFFIFCLLLVKLLSSLLFQGGLKIQAYLIS